MMLPSVYLDSNAGMPTRPEAIEAMLPYMSEHFGNISSIHSKGNEPKRAVEKARSQVAGLIGAEPEEIIFTSGATESVNLALRGTAKASSDRKVLTYTKVDHRSTVATAEDLRRSGFEVSALPIDEEGSVVISSLEDAIGPRTLIVTFPFASQEVGTIQPHDRIIDVSKDSGALTHIDLTRSAFQLPFDVEKAGVDMATLSSNDIMGPKGVGALYVRKRTPLRPILTGGGHERGLRSGSENVPGIVGMGEAARIALEERDDVARRLVLLRDRLMDGLLEIEDSFVNGSRVLRLPNNANVRFDFIEGESILLMMDLNGIQAASGSACSSKTLEPSPTLMAMGLKHEQAHGSMQMTLCPYTGMDDIDHVLKTMPGIVQSLREMSPLYDRGGR